MLELSCEELAERALRALLEDLDPYASLVGEAEWRQQELRLAGAFAGVGLHVEIDEQAGLPRVAHLMRGSLAGSAGVRPGDLLLAIEDRALDGLGLDVVLPLLRGAPGTTVTVTARRAGLEAPMRVTLERRSLPTPSVRGLTPAGADPGEHLLSAAPRVGYIRISRLAEDSASATERALDALQAQPLAGLVLDLRDSEGGLMAAAVGVADLFLSSGRILSHVFRRGTQTWDASPGGCTDVPMVVLVNGGTASSSEFLAAALQDNGRARVMGQRTYGKARVQQRFSLGEGRGGVILSTGTHVRPSGISIDRHDVSAAAEAAGVAPDPGLELVVEGEEYERWAGQALIWDLPLIVGDAELGARAPDRMLDRAVDLLVGARARTGGSGE
jgi:carboxyl-terminal processing protease